MVGYRTDENGKRHAVERSKRGFKTKQAALEYIPILKGVKTPHRTLADYWQIYSTDDLQRLSASKQTAYRIAYSKLGKLVYIDIVNISLDDLRKAVADKCKTYYTARDVKAVLIRLYALADAEGVGNPRLPQYINLPKLQQKQGEAFTAEQLTKIWQAYDNGLLFAGYILIMIYTGMMPGQLLGLRKSHIDIDNRQIVGAGAKTKVRKTTPISIAEIIVPVLLSMMNASEKDKIVVMNKDNFYSHYHEVIKEIGIRDLPPYSCRHTTATALAVGEAVAPEVIRKVMRWSTSKMLSRYAHPSAQDALEAVNKIGK